MFQLFAKALQRSIKITLAVPVESRIGVCAQHHCQRRTYNGTFDRNSTCAQSFSAITQRGGKKEEQQPEYQRPAVLFDRYSRRPLLYLSLAEFSKTVFDQSGDRPIFEVHVKSPGLRSNLFEPAFIQTGSNGLAAAISKELLTIRVDWNHRSLGSSDAHSE